MQSRILVPFLASLALTASAALAQEAAPPAGGPGAMRMHMDPAAMQKHRAEMCSNLYARAVGKMAELETRLDLTAVQKPLFERWKAVRLASAKSHAEACATVTFPGRDASIMDGLAFEQKLLEARLATLKAEAPSLEALVKTLTPDQQMTLKRAALRARHDRMEFMHRMGDRMRMFHRYRDDGQAPPPPAQ